MKFSEREDCDWENPEDMQLSSKDYEDMRALNRLLLTDYLQEIEENGLQEKTYTNTF